MKMFVDVNCIFLHCDPVDFRKAIKGVSQCKPKRKPKRKPLPKDLLHEIIIHADDMILQIINEDKNTCYMWV